MKRLVLIFAATMFAIYSFSQVRYYTMTYHNIDENDLKRYFIDPNTNVGTFLCWFNEPITLRTEVLMWTLPSSIEVGYLKLHEDSTTTVETVKYSVSESGAVRHDTTENAIWMHITNTNTDDVYRIVNLSEQPTKFPAITLYDTIEKEVTEYVTIFLDTTSIDNSIKRILSTGVQCYVSDGYLNVETSFIEEITIYTIEGKKVAYNQNFTSIFVGDLISGMYIAIIKKEGREYYHKFTL